jgi:multidrug efflux system membrane fusion protein
VQLDTLPGVLAAPAEAIEIGVDGPYVFVLGADFSVALRHVEAGPVAGVYRVIVSGLSAGERVVTSGQARLRDKSRVAVSAAVAAGPAGP